VHTANFLLDCEHLGLLNPEGTRCEDSSRVGHDFGIAILVIRCILEGRESIGRGVSFECNRIRVCDAEI